MKHEKNNSIQNNSPAGEFLQSSFWRKFQESVGRKVYFSASENFSASIIEHNLPIAGKYFYIPRGPMLKSSNLKFQISSQDQISNDKISKKIQKLVSLAENNNAGWIRIDPKDEKFLGVIKNNIKYKIRKASHDMQPKEIFVVDISKSEKDLLAEMKPKTRYNIRLAEKKGVKIFCDKSEKNIAEFLRLTQVMAKRNGIVAHPESYYKKMFENISGDVLKLYVAEYEGKIIAANLVIFYGETCVYLHGASDDACRSVMAPYLLQWQQIRDAKKSGCIKYDFGGVSFGKWQGITKFKLGFSPKTLPTIFPGSYDIVINRKKYWLYRTIQKIKASIKF
jgi:lipid II:glycine glycyltransferase (peptidoglycan interpeptide bridge formation enzyme)